MGLFDKKYCDICGEKIGLLGNRKLENGNLCKDCAKKLSPWFVERRSSTVEEIKAQLDWREANRERAAQFLATRSFGERSKLLLDETHRWFTITRANSPADDNSDVLDFSSITGCRMDISESRTELKLETQDREGKTVRKSYSPPRYEYDYDFYIIVSVNVPYFSEMKFQLNDRPVHIPFRPGRGFMMPTHEEPLYDTFYCGYKDMCTEICGLLEQVRSGAPEQRTTEKPAQNSFGAGASAPQSNVWTCPECGAENQGKFCESCGAKRPETAARCSRCGWKPDENAPLPKFCPECGQPF